MYPLQNKWNPKMNRTLYNAEIAANLTEGDTCFICFEGDTCFICFEGDTCFICFEGDTCFICFEGDACFICVICIYLRITMIYKTLHRKVKIEQHEPTKNGGVCRCSGGISYSFPISDTRRVIVKSNDPRF
jgi:hypothetical protein